MGLKIKIPAIGQNKSCLLPPKKSVFLALFSYCCRFIEFCSFNDILFGYGIKRFIDDLI
jgi:hypothetical protein